MYSLNYSFICLDFLEVVQVKNIEIKKAHFMKIETLTKPYR